MKLEDIKLKKGDIIYFDDNTRNISSYSYKSTIKETFNEKAIARIVKIERPVQYKIIYEAPKQILDKEEKEYLEAVIRPFRNKVETIGKHPLGIEANIWITVRNDDPIVLPLFPRYTMYKGMEPCKEYTLKELGLFEE